MIGDPVETDQGQYRHLKLEETVSTNSLCLEYATAGEPGNLWITTETQTGGKGSRGREWQSQAGNLFASLFIKDPCEKSRFVDLTFISALAVREAIEIFSNRDNQIKVKWPNDVMLNERKCSGILLETVHRGDVSCVVIGIGVNCQHFPPDTLHPATSLFAEGIEVSKDTFFKALVKTMASNISLWNKGQNFYIIRNKWLEHAYKLGETISVHIPGQTVISGRFDSIDDNGYLLLERTDGTLKQISTADIFFNNTDNG